MHLNLRSLIYHKSEEHVAGISIAANCVVLWMMWVPLVSKQVSHFVESHAILHAKKNAAQPYAFLNQKYTESAHKFKDSG